MMQSGGRLGVGGGGGDLDAFFKLQHTAVWMWLRKY